MAIAGYVSRLLREHLIGSGAGHVPAHADFDGVLLHLDIVGSTALTERFDERGMGGAERLGGILNLYFGDVFEIIEAHGGDVVRLEGDAVFALWRADALEEPAALRAARAAIDLRESLERWRPDLGIALHCRIALASGRLSAMEVRRPNERAFLVLTGEPIRQIAAASRAAPAGEVAATAGVATTLRSSCTLRELEGGFHLIDAAGGPLRPESGATRRAAPVEPPESKLRDFVPRILLERASAGQAAWLAEFRTVTMVYTHLAGLCTEGPDATRRLHETLGAVHEAVGPLGLPVMDFAMGEKGFITVVASGLPHHAQDNNAVRALQAARRIHAALHGLGVLCSIGVATGRAFCGDVGSASRREYLLTGRVMNHAARLMQHASGDILFDGPTAGAVAGHFEPSEPMSIAVKGRSRPLEVHRLTGAPKPRLHHGEGELHGREDEMRRVSEAFVSLDPARGTIMAIEAEAGAGKSHLLGHLASDARGRGFAMLSAATSPVEQMTPYFPWRTLVRQLLQRPEDPPEADAALLRRRLDEALHGAPVAAKAALIEDILPLGIGRTGLAREIRGAARLSGIEELVVHLARRAGSARPLVLLLDDLHWLDEPSARLLYAVARRVPRALVAVAARPLEAACPPFVRKLFESASIRIGLPRLPRESIVRMACDLLGVQSLPAHLGDFLQARSEGLPLHAQQLALSLRDRGLIEIANGRCRIVVSSLGAGALAESLGDVIVSRIDKLDAAHQVAAKVASALGRRFDLGMLREVYPIPADVARLEAMLADLAEAGILEPDASTGERAYRFRHGLIQEVAHQLLPFEKRVPLHRRIAQVIEQRHALELEPHYAELAEHLEQANEPGPAIAYREKAAAVAQRRYDNHDTLSQLEQIGRVAERFAVELPPAMRARLAHMRGDACHALSRFADAEKHYLECAALSGIAVPAGRGGLARGVAMELARQLLHRCAIRRRTAGPEQLERERLAAHIYTRLAEQAYFAGDALKIMHGTLASLNRAERVGSVHEIVEGYGALAIGMGTAGAHRIAQFYRTRSLRWAEARGGLHDQGIAHLFAAVYSFQAGKWDAALDHSRKGAETCQRIGDRFRYQSCLVVGAYAEIALGRYVEAELLLRSFGDDAEDVENVPVRAWILAGRGVVDMLLGRGAAEALARIAAARDAQLHRAERLLCDGLEAAAWLHTGDAQAALRAAQAALENMMQSPPTMGIALFSVWGTAEVLLSLAEREPQRPEPAQLAREACRAARLYAAKAAIFRPRALLLMGRLAALQGNAARARGCRQRALREAARLRMPLEQALCQLALGDPEGTRALQRLGARPWLCEPPPGEAKRTQDEREAAQVS